jgi:signal transduction histidine kinase
VLLIKTLKSSTFKLALVYVVAFSAAVFALFGYVYWTTAAYLHRTLNSAVAAERALLLNVYESSGSDGLIGLISKRMDDRHFDDWVYLVADDSFLPISGNLRSWPSALRGAQGWGNFESAERQFAPSVLNQFRATYQVLPDGHRLLLGRNVGELTRLSENMTIGLACAAGLFLLLAAAAGISTSRRSVARIEAINATSREIMRSGLEQRIPLRGTRDEWDELAQNLNSMLDRIQELAEANRQVSDNVAHDLRTPLSRLRGRLERASSRQASLDEYRSLVNDTIIELDDILKIFSALLRISQIEMLERTANFHTIDLSEITREVVELFDPTAEERSTRLRLCESEPISVIGDRDLLFDAISNLLDNALKHGGVRGAVTVAVRRGPGGPVLLVADRGPGIPIDERQHVLKRFYRLEHSRNSPGNGLGLSLVAAVANLHNAHLEMADNSPGLRVELHFPFLETAPSSPDEVNTFSCAQSGRGRPLGWDG